MENKPSTEQLLELLKYYSAESLRNEQTKLTKAGNQVREVATGKLGALFNTEEKEVLLQAAMLLQSLKTRVERAKEVKSQMEARAEQERKANEAVAHKLLRSVIPGGDADSAGRVELLAWALVLQQMNRFCFAGNHGWVSYSRHTEVLKEEMQARYVAATKNELHPDRRIERQARPAYETTLAFFNDLNQMVVDSLKDEFRNDQSGFSERFNLFLQKFRDQLYPQLLETDGGFLASFQSKINEDKAANKFVSGVVASLKK